MSKSQRTKGAAFEREIAGILTKRLGRPVTRELSQTRDGGRDLSLPPFSLELKRRVRIGVYPWLKQAEAATDYKHPLPVVVARADKERAVAIIPIEVFVAMIKLIEYSPHLQLDDLPYEVEGNKLIDSLVS